MGKKQVSNQETLRRLRQQAAAKGLREVPPIARPGAAINWKDRPRQPKKMLVVVPCTGQIDAVLALWLFHQAAPDTDIAVHIHQRAGFVEDVRQEVADLFREAGHEWLLMVDNDTIPSRPARALVERAEQAGAKLVSYPVPFHGSAPGISSNIFVPAEDGKDLDAVAWHSLPWEQTNILYAISAAGLGATLIHRDVINGLMEKAKETGDYPFRALWKNGKIDLGEDQAFFVRAGMAGVQPYTDLWCPCTHRKIISMTPNHAVEDIPFFTPDVRCHPRAPYIKRDVRKVEEEHGVLQREVSNADSAAAEAGTPGVSGEVLQPGCDRPEEGRDDAGDRVEGESARV